MRILNGIPELATTPSLRRMIQWSCGIVGYDHRLIWVARFDPTRKTALRGRAYLQSSSIEVLVGTDAAVAESVEQGWLPRGICRWGVLVAVTAHEVAHLSLYRENGFRKAKRGRNELASKVMEAVALQRFLDDRDALLARWGVSLSTPAGRDLAAGLNVLPKQEEDPS